MHLTASTVGEVSAASSDQLPQSSHRALGDSISGLLITDPIPATTTDTRDLDSSMVSEEDRGLLSGHATDTERSMALSTQTVEAAAGSPIMSTLDSRDGELGQARPSCSDSPEPRAAAMSLAAITSIVPEEAGTPSTAHTEMTEDTPMPAEIPTIEETARTEASALISVHPTGDRDNNGSMLEPGEVEGQVLGNSQSSHPPISPSRLTWHPSALLNPRGNRLQSDTKLEVQSRSNLAQYHGGHTALPQRLGVRPPQSGPKRNISQLGDDDQDREHEMSTSEQPGGGFGMAQMIGAVHGVQNRQAPKRQKIERSSDDPRKPVIFEAHTGGELGAYIDEHKAKDAQIRAIPETIDLTEELDSQSAGPPPSADEIVCFGMFDGVRVNVQMIPFASSDNDFKLHGLGCWPILMCKTSPGYPKDQSSRDNPVINVHDGKGNIFGKLASPHGIAISKLISWQPLRAKLSTTFLQKRPLKGGETVGSPVSEAHPIQVLLYGRKSCANALVYRLQSFKLSLVHPPPSRIKKGLLYFNPYEALTSAEQTSMGLTAGGQSLFPHDVRTLEEVQAEVMNIFDSLGDVELLEEYPDPPFITTSLLKHQKQALSFMSLKEGKRLFSNSEPGNNTFWRKKRRANGQVFYKFLLFGHEQDREPGESRGGILADVMGLGKTLSILALAASTRADARDFEGEEVPPTDPGERKVFFQSRATLIICPLSVINNWVEQVSAHMDMDQVRIRVQHGSTRLTDPKALKDHDVVITTYHQIANEYSGRAYRGISPMSQINWFRIVLDEAHMIRTSKTQMAKSVCRLHAQRRWSVTGTPVQNRLEDLGSLLTFLRLEPVHDKASFGRYVSGPLKSTTDKHTLATLRCLVDSIALRRDKSKIDLPPRHDIRVDLEFSKEETRVHNTLRKDSENQVKAITKNKSGTVGKAYIHVLQSILRLRQACAHGKELLGEEDVRFLEGHDVDTAINLDAEEDDDPFGMKAKFSAEEVYRTVRLMLDTDACRCCMCSNVISPTDIDGSVSDGADGTFGYMSRCFDLICTDCINDFQAGVKKHETDPKAGYCPKCGQIIIAQAQFPLEAQEYENHIDEHLQSNDKSAASRGKKWHGTYSGPSTKVKRLIQMLNDDKYASQMAPGKPVIKSVIFSGWTQHLDLIEIALKANQTTFCRLDGRMDREARKRSLDRFALRDGGPTVILVSIAAGGLGLNLTRACKAYVMEPQYNPQAEAQAVDRVHRLGQTEEVTITRFIMKDSFEHKVIEVQDRKKQIATMTVDRKRAREAMTQQNKLIELKALFAPVPRSKPS